LSDVCMSRSAFFMSATSSGLPSGDRAMSLGPSKKPGEPVKTLQPAPLGYAA
jgi:hypothetical protein